MPALHDILTLLITIQFNLYGSYSLAPQGGLRKSCSSCSGLSGAMKGHIIAAQAGEASTSMLGLGEPCGVYTQACDKGLRCLPPDSVQSPLQVLLQGRGICSSVKASTKSPPPTESQPLISENSEKGPCRKLLNTILQGIKPTVIQSNQDIYIPNCDRQGYFRRKQCRSSRGVQRGQCWCVDLKGTRAPSQTREDGFITCSSA
ncbi:insulin-like growth factor-binding protein 6a [Electrophorus electricus]|uniref:insulin-like growth factor-binding protein 6a n=1 Tax=Electrophorus electricus TaxID=8005 RepID=UPI0015D02022|nr:insulin-like growth factor-binding protein 6a [Electrophorus electricus]